MANIKNKNMVVEINSIIGTKEKNHKSLSIGQTPTWMRLGLASSWQLAALTAPRDGRKAVGNVLKFWGNSDLEPQILFLVKPASKVEPKIHFRNVRIETIFKRKD